MMALELLQRPALIDPANLVDGGRITRIYADGIAMVLPRGPNFVTVLFAWREDWLHGGRVQFPENVGEIIRPRASIFGGPNGEIARALAAQERGALLTLH